MKRNRCLLHYARKRTESPHKREDPGSDVQGHAVPQSGTRLSVMELTFRENKLSGERFSFPDSIRPQVFQTRGRDSESFP